MDMELNHHLKITVSTKAWWPRVALSPLFGWASFWFCPHVFLISPASDSIFPRSLIQFPADSTRPPLPSCMGRFRRCRRARRLPSTLEVRTVWPNYLHSGEFWHLENVISVSFNSKKEQIYCKKNWYWSIENRQSTMWFPEGLKNVGWKITLMV